MARMLPLVACASMQLKCESEHGSVASAPWVVRDSLLCRGLGSCVTRSSARRQESGEEIVARALQQHAWELHLRDAARRPTNRTKQTRTLASPGLRCACFEVASARLGCLEQSCGARPSLCACTVRMARGSEGGWVGEWVGAWARRCVGVCVRVQQGEVQYVWSVAESPSSHE